MANYKNLDGLLVRYGLDTAKGAQVGAPSVLGAVKQWIGILEAGRLTLAGGLIGGVPDVVFPVGSVILRANLIVTETFTSGGAATLDLGLANKDGTYTNLNETGIAAAIALATLAAGSVVALTGALVGAGTARATTVVSYPSYDVDVALYTAGKALMVIEYVEPMYPDQNPD